MFRRMGQYYTEVKGELKKSTWPKWTEVKNTTIVVIITVFIFAGFLYISDLVLSFSVLNLKELLRNLLQ